MAARVNQKIGADDDRSTSARLGRPREPEAATGDRRPGLVTIHEQQRARDA